MNNKKPRVPAKDCAEEKEAKISGRKVKKVFGEKNWKNE